MVIERRAGDGRKNTAVKLKFQKADRLLRRSEFVELRKLGKKLQNQYFIVYVHANNHQHCRLGITITKKVGKAVNRNRIKRMAREYFRLNRQKIIKNWDVNLIAKIEVSDISNKVIFISLDNIFSRVAAINHE